MSDDLRDRCTCADCNSARKQINFHSERNRRVREEMEKQYGDLINRACTKPLPDPGDEREPVNRCKCHVCTAKNQDSPK